MKAPHMTLPLPTLEQENAIDLAYTWFNTSPSTRAPYFTLTGFAGTGKTFTIKALITFLNLNPSSVRFAAYTGKAASVIAASSGFPATTIHSLIYTYVPSDRKHSEPHFILNPDSKLLNCSLLILDECSMVDEDLLKDLLSFNVPIIALGDPGQLPPIHNASALFSSPPDVHLTTIHRQAANSPIISLSLHIRKGLPISLFPPSAPALTIDRSHDPDTYLSRYPTDQILCGKNKTRRTINSLIRNTTFDSRYPIVGDKLCCWKNDKGLGIFNGELFTVLHLHNTYLNHIELTLKQEYSNNTIRVRALLAYFDAYFDENALFALSSHAKAKYQHFDFGYCLTIHKSQGSQWPRVLFIDDGLYRGMRGKLKQRKQFLYTAVTRASETLNVITT